MSNTGLHWRSKELDTCFFLYSLIQALNYQTTELYIHLEEDWNIINSQEWIQFFKLGSGILILTWSFILPSGYLSSVSIWCNSDQIRKTCHHGLNNLSSISIIIKLQWNVDTKWYGHEILSNTRNIWRNIGKYYRESGIQAFHANIHSEKGWFF